MCRNFPTAGYFGIVFGCSVVFTFESSQRVTIVVVVLKPDVQARKNVVLRRFYEILHSSVGNCFRKLYSLARI